jgi:hypothetical protein
MVKINFTPSIAVMAAFTTFLLIKSLVKVRFMDVIMAIDTTDTDLPETPFVTLFMTGKTGGCQVGTCQLKCSLVMPFNGKVGPLKTKSAVTIGTIGRTALNGKLLIMVICMTIGTSIVFYPRCITGFMTPGAGNKLMFSHQGIIGLGMVEII